MSVFELCVEVVADFNVLKHASQFVDVLCWAFPHPERERGREGEGEGRGR